jgi:AcrR family transcriptional regulator
MASKARAAGGRPERKRRSDGERSRNTILREAAQLATVEGITGLSIARLADAVGMSKSGLFAHFGSKEELQLATIATAHEIFVEQVVEPASGAAGLERLNQLLENFLRHVEDSVYRGGCFFASVAAEVDTRPGPVRERAIGLMDGWLRELEWAVRGAIGEGSIDVAGDPGQLVFELNGFLLQANALFVAHGDAKAIERARRAIARRLEHAAR